MGGQILILSRDEIEKKNKKKLKQIKTIRTIIDM
jgi:hypothetical protein